MNPSPRFRLQPRHVMLAALYLASALTGWTVAYGFGVRASGLAWMGVLAGANGAVFCTLLVDAVASRLTGRARHR